MARALTLAARGLATTTPNPRVGCVLVRNDALVGEGWHQRAGEPHAEVHALRAAGEAARGATAYVTLEPCAHVGRTPPCADALVAAGVGRVVAAMQDPNPLVAGQGLARLAAAGIDVAVGLMAAQAEELNAGFISRMTRGRPWVRLKMAASLDGRTALANGQSQWITGQPARDDVQRWRARACAMLTGAGTVIADDPQMNVRLPGATRQPLRVVVSSRLRIEPSARILQHGPTLVAHADADPGRQAVLAARGVALLACPDGHGQVDLEALLRHLATRGINEVMVEAGARLAGALVAAGLVDEYLIYLAPALMGDPARGLLALPALAAMDQVPRLAWVDVRRVGEDLRLLLRPR